MSNSQYDRAVKILELFGENARFVSKKNIGVSAPPGWLELMQQLFAAFAESGCDDIRLQQLKEKFGGLRVYYEGGNDELWEKVQKIEEQSYKVCVWCGEPSTGSRGGWIRYTCDKHKDTHWDDAFSPEQRETLSKMYDKISRKFRAEFEF